MDKKRVTLNEYEEELVLVALEELIHSVSRSKLGSSKWKEDYTGDLKALERKINKTPVDR